MKKFLVLKEPTLSPLRFVVVVTERDHRKMYKGSENADGKSVVNSSSGGSTKRCRELEIYRRDRGFV